MQTNTLKHQSLASHMTSNKLRNTSTKDSARHSARPVESLAGALPACLHSMLASALEREGWTPPAEKSTRSEARVSAGFRTPNPDRWKLLFTQQTILQQRLAAKSGTGTHCKHIRRACTPTTEVQQCLAAARTIGIRLKAEG